jgi:protein O-GlcNAc transferase
LQHIQQALTLHQNGQLEEAQSIYRSILDQQPGNADALHLLGLIAYQMKDFTQAEALIARAIALNARHPAYHANRGLVLHRMGRFADAVASHDCALALQPDAADTHANRGASLRELGRREEAVASYDRALALKPDHAGAHYNRGNALKELNRLEQALPSYDRAVALSPAYAEAWANRGTALQDLGRFAEALASYDRVIALRPDHAEAHYNRGHAMKGLDRLADAVASYDRALALRPDYAEAWSYRGVALQDLGRLDDALASYDRALALKPDHADTYSHRANAFLNQGKLDEAVVHYQRALALKPDFAAAHGSLAKALTAQGRFAEAQEHYERALALDPRADAPWRGLNSLLTYRPDLGVDERFERQRTYGRAMAARVAEPLPPLALDQDPQRRLRIGWLSSDFRRHPVGWNLQPFFEHRDRSRFEAMCYADVRAPDSVTAWFRGHCDAWQSIVGLGDRAVAERIRADRIDVLVFLAGRFDENRLQLAAWRAAPVQVSMFDVATCGLDAMDYLVADRLMVPARGAERFTERVLRLPNTYVHPGIGEAPPVVAPPSLTQGHVTFGCFNNPAKVNDRVLALWAQLLARVPGSRLVLTYQNHFQSASLRERIEAIMGRHGIDRSRLELGGVRAGRNIHLVRYGGIDIALDPFPFNGSTTTFEALWMGVPVVTLEGGTLVSRWSGAQLRHAGLPELVARTAEDYLAIGVALAGDGGRLAALRSDLRRRVQASILCDAQRTTRYLERGLRALWNSHGKRTLLRRPCSE